MSIHFIAQPFAENIPNQRRPRVAPRVAQIDDEGQVAVVDGDPAEVDDAGDALLLALDQFLG